MDDLLEPEVLRGSICVHWDSRSPSEVTYLLQKGRHRKQTGFICLYEEKVIVVEEIEVGEHDCDEALGFGFGGGLAAPGMGLA